MAGVALVLGAGGVVGHGWHAGVLAALEEAGWDSRRADVVVGTSAGSAVGATLRAGISGTDLHARASGGTMSAESARILAAAGITAPPVLPLPERPGRLTPPSPRLVARAAMSLRPSLLAAAMPAGQVDNTVIAQGIDALHRGGWPSAALWVCAVRADDGHRIVFGRDRTDVPVGTAVAASCAIPGWYRPVKVDGRDLVDGGVHSPTNADVVGRADVDVVVVSSPMSLDGAALRRPTADRVMRMAARASLLREVTPLRRRGITVVTFQPGPEDLDAMGSPVRAMDPARRRAAATQAFASTQRRLRSGPVREALESVLA